VKRSRRSGLMLSRDAEFDFAGLLGGLADD
jgi:hypothetical protein